MTFELKERIDYFDLLRGIAIILVVSIHSFGNMLNILNCNSFGFHFAILWRQMIGCAVPLFLSISGYFLSKRTIDSKQQYLTFIKKQIPRVYLPCLIWSSLLFIKSILHGENVGLSVLNFLLCGYSVYYFIFLIIQYYFLLPILKRNANLNGLKLSALISIVSLLFFFYIDKIAMINLPLIIYAGPFPVWIVFFVLGLYLGSHTIKTSFPNLFILTICGLVLSISETYFDFYITETYKGLGIKISSFVYSFAIILMLFSISEIKLRNTILNRILIYLGKISFGIYLIHMFVLPSVVRLYSTKMIFINQILHIVLTIFICSILIFIMRKINLNFSKKYLGF